ncbi:1338_t:CDS:2, partial [Gigaspora rosea]
MKEAVVDKGKSKEVVDKKGKSKEVVDKKGKSKEVVNEKGKSEEVVDEKGKSKEVVVDKSKAKEIVNEKNKKKEIENSMFYRNPSLISEGKTIISWQESNLSLGESSCQDPDENKIVETLASSTNFLKSLLESEEEEE